MSDARPLDNLQTTRLDPRRFRVESLGMEAGRHWRVTTQAHHLRSDAIFGVITFFGILNTFLNIRQ